MGYIGATPVIGNFQKCDAITTSATDTFNLLVGGVAVSPATPQNCIVSLNGVVQAPTSAYTISGSTIVFDSALTTSDVIDFIVILGNVLDIGIPSDDTVSTSKIQDEAVTSGKLAAGAGGLAWQSVTTATTLTAVAGKAYPINTTSNACTVTLPGSASVGDQIIFTDYLRTWGTNALTINQNSLKYQGNTSPNPVYNTNGESVHIVYVDATQGWTPTYDGAVAMETAQSYDIEYVCIAGGGGGGSGIASGYSRGGGGGGAGGYFNTYASESSGGGDSDQSGATKIESIAAGAVLTVVVGGGGAGGSGSGVQGVTGNDSTITPDGGEFTTITAAAGGGGGKNAAAGTNGGCGGGGGSGGAYSGGTGTTDQGYGGGAAFSAECNDGGGGGGASSVGQGSDHGTTDTGAGGGAGYDNTITTASVGRGGGGGGGSDQSTPGPATHGGGNGGPTGTAGTNATANTGGGGGGSGSNPPGTLGGNGGSGVVILRMPDDNYSGTTTGSPTVEADAGSSGETVITFNSDGTYTT